MIAWSRNVKGRPCAIVIKPERELGHLDGHRVTVDGVDALRHNVAPCLNMRIGGHWIDCSRLKVSRGQLAVLEPRLDQLSAR